MIIYTIIILTDISIYKFKYLDNKIFNKNSKGDKMAVFYFETILKVKLLGMQVTTVKINFTEDMDRNNISLRTYDFFIRSENTDDVWCNIPIVGMKWKNKRCLYLKLVNKMDYLPIKLLKLKKSPPDVFTQDCCRLEYNLQQKLSVYTKNNKSYDINTKYILKKEHKKYVEEFKSFMFKDLNYSIYIPKIKAKKHALIVWLHGAGEGGNNASNIMADKGAVTYLKKDTQYLFKGAYVLAPQSPTYWVDEFKMEENIFLKAKRCYTKDLTELILQIKQKYMDIDESRIYLAGASMGGYQVLELLAENPFLYAGAIISCPAKIPIEENLRVIKNNKIPIWLLHCVKDNVVPLKNTEYIYNYLKNEDNTIKVTYYPKIIVQGKEINPHCVFIYMYENLPEENGTRLFEWLSEQRRGK